MRKEIYEEICELAIIVLGILYFWQKGFFSDYTYNCNNEEFARSAIFQSLEKSNEQANEVVGEFVEFAKIEEIMLMNINDDKKHSTCKVLYKFDLSKSTPEKLARIYAASMVEMEDTPLFAIMKNIFAKDKNISNDNKFQATVNDVMNGKIDISEFKDYLTQERELEFEISDNGRGETFIQCQRTFLDQHLNMLMKMKGA